MDGVRCIESTAAGDAPHKSFRALGPTLLISMAYLDLGKWLVAMEAGSRFGYDLVLLVLFFNLSAILCQYLSTRIGMVTGKNLAEAGLSLLTCEVSMIAGTVVGFKLVFEYDDLITTIWFTSVVVNVLPYTLSLLVQRRFPALTLGSLFHDHLFFIIFSFSGIFLVNYVLLSSAADESSNTMAVHFREAVQLMNQVAGSEGLYQLLIMCPVIQAMFLPSSVIPIFRVSSSRLLMGRYKISLYVEILAFLAFLLTLLTNIIFVAEILFGDSTWTNDLKGNTGSPIILPYAAVVLISCASIAFTLFLAVNPLKSACTELRDRCLCTHREKHWTKLIRMKRLLWSIPNQLLSIPVIPNRLLSILVILITAQSSAHMVINPEAQPSPSINCEETISCD